MAKKFGYPSKKFWWSRDRKFARRQSAPRGNQCEKSHFLVNVGPACCRLLPEYSTSMLWSIDSCQYRTSVGSSVDPLRLLVFFSLPLTVKLFSMIKQGDGRPVRLLLCSHCIVHSLYSFALTSMS